jgi:3-oxoacyl-[acyl-carrier-protein] synthase II
MGGLPLLEETVKLIAEKGPRRISPFFIPSVIPNLTSGHLSIYLNARAHNACVVSACASGAHSVGESALIISRGDADIMIAGGCEAVISNLGVGGFAAMKALSTRNDSPERASRPFDRDRDGFVVGEGAGVLILEDYEHAKKRGARIYAEVAGYASNSDANHMTAPCEDGRGAGECMEFALSRAQIDPRKIDYINAHGTSTPMGDIAESLAVERLFGSHARELVMTSTKSMTGHLLGGAGGLESCVAIKVLETGDIPPTINLENPDEKCRLNYAAGEAIRKDCDTVMNNSFGFGGTNASLIFSRV